MNEIIVIPIHQVKDMIQSAVKECMTEIMALSKPHSDTASVDIDGAVEYLNANGYRIRKSQIYKLTSAGQMPFHKFGSKLHFRIGELSEWAQSRLLDGNAIGILEPMPSTKTARR